MTATGVPPVLLASTSPTRAALLRAVGLAFECRAPAVDEPVARASLRAAGRTTLQLAEDLAVAKARDVSAGHPHHLVIGADQMLLVGAGTLDKPGTRAGVIDSLRSLRGRTHTLASGVALVTGGIVDWRHTATAQLTMRDLTDAEIEQYADRVGDTVFGCVGAYRIEGPGLTLFTEIAGDHTTILGLPMLPLLAELRRRKVMLP